jgi:hypothetical protein
VTSPQREHLVSLERKLRLNWSSRFDYPPGDQRTNRDGFSWHLSEGQMFSFLEGGGRPEFDCSEWVPWLHRCAGSWRWSAAGYTGSHLQTWRATGWLIYSDARGALPGSIAIFFREEGPATGSHEATVIEADRQFGNPLLSSHGEPGLEAIHLRDLVNRDGFSRVEFLSVTKL